jgi:cation:H+ antiporter
MFTWVLAIVNTAVNDCSVARCIFDAWRDLRLEVLPMTILLMIVGLGLLVAGAEALVRGASRLAAAFGISPLVIGLTVVAFGTSSPEMAVSVMSAYAGQADLAVGNVVGSNIFNVLFILGLSAAIAPLLVSRQLIRLDVPIMIGISFLLLLLALDGSINRLDGVILFAGIISYTAFQIIQARREKKANDASEEVIEKPHTPLQWLTNVGFVIGGLLLLVLGSNWLVDGAVYIAQSLGVSELIIGLTIVAAGTSLPEVATSVIASIRGQRDIAVGNVVGSNIFNILAVLGLSSLVSPESINVAASALRFDIPVMLAVALACLPIFFTGRVIARWEGFVFLAYYVIYTVYLILAATQNNALTTLDAALLWFVLPMTVITLLVLTVGSLRARNKTKAV